MKCSDYIAKYLSTTGVDTVFGYTGGSVADLIDAICRYGEIRFVAVQHEQAAAFAACGYGRVKKSLGVAVASSGPGACNLLGGVANAFFDSIPVLFITGNVHSLARNKFPGVRQSSFQEMNIVEMAKGITKYAYEVTTAEEIPHILNVAVSHALGGRPGPVLIDIPYNIQRSEISNNPKNFSQIQDLNDYDKSSVPDVTQWLLSGKKPLVLIGGGCQTASKEVFEFVRKNNLPVVCTLRGLDIIPHSYRNFMGFVGSYGNRYANLAVRYCDRLLVLGARLDERVMGWKNDEFAPEAQIIQVDIDSAELKKNSKFFAALRMDIKAFAYVLAEKTFAPVGLDVSEKQWLEVLYSWKNRYPSDAVSNTVSMNGFVKNLSLNCAPGTIFCSDVGQHQMSVAQSIFLSESSLLLNSAGYGSMGYSLPAAIGAAYASPETAVISLNGDGGLQMNIQELQTLQRGKLPVTVIVFNNNGLGLIRQLQKKIFDGRFYASEIGFSNPDFEKIADAYNMAYCKVESIADYAKVWSFIKTHKRSVIEVMIPLNDTNLPEPGDKIYNQIPMLSVDENILIEKEAKTCL